MFEQLAHKRNDTFAYKDVFDMVQNKFIHHVHKRIIRHYVFLYRGSSRNNNHVTKQENRDGEKKYDDLKLLLGIFYYLLL